MAKTANTTKKAPSKKSIAIGVVKRMQARKNAPTRKQILAEVASKASLSDAAAATYYQNITSGRTGWEIS